MATSSTARSTSDVRNTVYFSGGGMEVYATMPDELQVQIEQEYENPVNTASNVALQGVTQYFGAGSLKFDNSAFFVWMGGNPIQLSFEVIFVADSSINDVRIPVRNLMKMVSPLGGADGGVIGNLKEPFSRERPLSVRFGTLLRLDDCLLTSVVPTLGRPLHTSGIPMRVPVQVELQARKIFTRDQVDTTIFPG